MYFFFLLSECSTFLLALQCFVPGFSFLEERASVCLFPNGLGIQWQRTWFVTRVGPGSNAGYPNDCMYVTRR